MPPSRNLSKIILTELKKNGAGTREQLIERIKTHYGIDIPMTTLYDYLKKLRDNAGLVVDESVNVGVGRPKTVWKLLHSYTLEFME